MYFFKKAFQCTCPTETSCFATYKMESYCLKCKKTHNTENIDPQVSSTSNGRVMILSNVQYVVVKNADLLNTKKQKDY